MIPAYTKFVLQAFNEYPRNVLIDSAISVVSLKDSCITVVILQDSGFVNGRLNCKIPEYQKVILQ